MSSDLETANKIVCVLCTRIAHS